MHERDGHPGNGEKKLERLFALIERFAFQGHTHVPGVFTEDGRFLSPDEIDGRFPLAGFTSLGWVATKSLGSKTTPR